MKDSDFGIRQRSSKYLGLNWKYLTKYLYIARQNVEAPGSRSDAASSGIKDTIIDHYKHRKVSTQMPNKKNVGKDNAAKHVLQKTIEKTYRYQSFQEEHLHVNMSFSKFAALQPKHAAFLQPLADVIRGKELNWQIWGETTFRGNKRKALLHHHGQFNDLLQKLQVELVPFTCHLFEAHSNKVSFGQS